MQFLSEFRRELACEEGSHLARLNPQSIRQLLDVVPVARQTRAHTIQIRRQHGFYRIRVNRLLSHAKSLWSTTIILSGRRQLSWPVPQHEARATTVRHHNDPAVSFNGAGRRKGDVTMHGFRSSFRDWCSESVANSFPREVCEHALAHSLPDATEAAYRRGDLIEKRTLLMQAWADYCAVIPAAANVTPIRGKAAS